MVMLLFSFSALDICFHLQKDAATNKAVLKRAGGLCTVLLTLRRLILSQ